LDLIDMRQVVSHASLGTGKQVLNNNRKEYIWACCRRWSYLSFYLCFWVCISSLGNWVVTTWKQKVTSRKVI